eukprot:COSAG01_NODE_3738_length_5746_cov_133.642642_7_plen_382_part_01
MFKTFARDRTVAFDGESSMHFFLSESLRKIQRGSSKKQKELRPAIERALQVLGGIEPAAADAISKIKAHIATIFEPLRLTCDAKNPKMCSFGLDCVAKLMEYGYLKGDATVGGAAPQPLLIDQAVECICECFAINDDEIQLQIIEALLKGTIAPGSDVHEGSLLTAVRTVYNIYLNSRNMANTQAAHTAMQQMLDTVYARMEEESAVAATEELADTAAPGPVPVPCPEPGAGDGPIDGGTVPPPVVEQPEVEGGESLGQQGAGRDGGEEAAAPPVVHVAGQGAAEAEAAAEAPADAGDTADSGGQHRRGSVVNLAQAAAAQSDMPGGEVDDDAAELGGTTFPNIYQKDGYLLFRALCRLSMKQVAPGSLPDSVPVRSKLQAL